MIQSDPALTDTIVLVDDNGMPIGSADKLSSHHDATPLHLAFSCYIFDHAGNLLLTQRAASKKVWPTVWTNSCCGHPRPNESNEDAIQRRVEYELGMTVTDVRLLLPDYRYKTTPYNGIIENEICPVYAARADSAPKPNPLEVMDYKWLPWEEFLVNVAEDDSGTMSWWCKDQASLLQEHSGIHSYLV